MARNYRHLSLEERDTIMRMRDRCMPVGRIAAELRRHPATIYRELRRNFFYDEDAWFRGYFGRVAHRKAASRRVCGGKVNRDRELAARIVEHLQQCWSPEQIAGRLRLDKANPITVCHETIYQFVYGTEGRRQAGRGLRVSRWQP
ncbi:Helix-turn-helix domain-containing protein [Novosphingobium sp. B1]|nr:Helix-turn-helix domain-containing protein [Novosphingobium sp. B1]